ncbi:metallophosphoesterase family protein [Chloroflexota bacterium]
MMTNLHFAQLSDIHLSSLGDRYDMLSSRAVEFLTGIVAIFNQTDDLDFVLITGDLFDTASQEELDHFQQAIRTLKKPWYVIPGNHDRRDMNASEGLTRHQFARHFNSQINSRPTAPESQAGYWSLTIKSNIQLIGLDSNRDRDWGGIIDTVQFEWLENELATHADKLIILAVHHPLHPLAPIDHHPEWTNFVCDNDPDMLALLDRHPQAKIVLTGHHHLTKIDTLGQRVHLACPAMVIYPCAYRTLRVNQQAEGTWLLEWQTHPVTDEATLADARERMFNGWKDMGFAEHEFVGLAFGSERDRNGKVYLR